MLFSGATSVRLPIKIFYPAIEWTREESDAREPAITFLACDSCQHRLGFQSHAEAARFAKSSGWHTVSSIHGQQVRCPVCSEAYAQGKPIRMVHAEAD